MTRYLLGELNQRAQERIEERWFTQSGVWRRLERVEEKLIDDYVYNKLPARQRQRFEEHFLPFDDRLESVEIAKGLKRLAAKDSPVSTGAPSRLRTLYLLPAAAFAALMVVGVLWLGIENRNRGTPPTLEFQLSPMLTRGEGDENRLVVPRGTRWLVLKVPLEGVHYPQYQATVRTPEGKHVLDLAASWGPDSNSLSLKVHAVALRPGDYRLELQGITSNGQREGAGEYALRIRSK